MNEQVIRDLLVKVQQSETGLDEAVQILRRLPYDDIEFAHLDTHRALRTGFPEVVFCQGKRPEHATAIIQRLAAGSGPVLGTRAERSLYEAVKIVVPAASYNELAHTIVYEPIRLPKRPGTIMVITAGTADIPVAEEAAVTAEIMGNTVERLYDVGVAGLHRLLAHLPRIQQATVLIVVAGMEGALPSVVGGLVKQPVIAVPTSVGYGANFGGLSALLGMLNSCAAGVTVVNIDNGFGAGYAAALINRCTQGDVS